MHRVLVLGAGKIGALISGLLAESKSYEVDVADVSEATAAGVVKAHGITGLRSFGLDASNEAALTEHLRKNPVDAVVSSLPFYCNAGVARAARLSGCHYFDLTEDVELSLIHI